MKNFSIKRFTASLLFIVMVVAALPASLFNFTISTSAADGDTIYVLAGGDFQAGDNDQADHYYSRINMGNILDKIKENYSTMNGFIFVGDYDGDTHNDSNANAGVAAMMEEVSERFGTLNHNNSYLIEGNHETGAVSGIDATGGYDCDGYAVYLINETDFCERQAGKSAQIQTVANNLKTWLNNKIGEGYDAPIFVATHTPLGYTTRTYTNGDSLYGKYVFDVLNDAAANGLNIIFMHGHDHAYGADNYLGGEAIYLPVGDKINICVPGDKTAWTEETLNFTYMNAGYVGYYNENYYNVDSYEAEKLTMTVFAISGNQVTVERWSKDGLYNLKSAGREGFYNNASTCANIGLSYNTTVYASPQTIALVENDADEMGTIGEWVGVTSTVTDDVTASSNGWVQITEPSTGETTYTYTQATSITAGGKYVIVANGYDVALQGTTSLGTQSVTINGTTMTSTTELTLWTFSANSNGTNTVSMSINNGSRYLRYSGSSFNLNNTSANLYVSDRGDTFRIQNSTSTSYARYFYYNGSLWTRSNSGSAQAVRLYQLTDTTTSNATNGVWYKIVDNKSDKDFSYDLSVDASAQQALDTVYDGVTVYKYEGTTAPTTSTTGTAVSDSDVTWTLASNYSGSTAGDYAVTITKDGKTLGTAEVVVPATTTYYMAEGHGLYLVDMNTTEANAMAEVMAGVTVYSATDENGTGKKTIDDADVTWEWVDTYNGADSGPYTVEILKDGTSLGTVEVKVNIQYETGIESDWTYIGESEATGGTYTYTLDTDGIDSDGQYIIVAENQALALHTSGSSAATAVSVNISSDGKTLTTDTRDYEYYWNSTYGFTRDGYNGLYQSSWAIYLGTKSESYLDGVVNHNNGKYTLYDNEGNERGLYYNGSSWTVNDGGTTTDYKVRLYKYTGMTGGTPGGPVYALIEGDTVYTVAQGSSATKALAAVKAGITGYTATDANGTGKTELSDSDLTWTWKNTFNGNSTGSYWVEISYQGKVLGTVEVKVEPAVVDDYPDYPDEGAVKVNKTAIYTEEKFRESGVAQVELSVSGVPSKKGADVIVMLDTSSSMESWCVTCNAKFDTTACNHDNQKDIYSRAAVLEEALKDLIAQFKKPGDDGQLLDIRVALADFNGFYGDNHNSSGTPYDRDATDMMSDDISYNANSEAQVYTGNKTLGAGAFIPAEDLAATYTLNYTSGTNYDYAFDAVYQLGTAIKDANGNEKRDLYVIFMSDGAAMQWNYYHSQGASSLWNNWITGAWTANQLSLNCNTHAYYYDEVDHNGDGMRNEHRMANAIKGDPSEQYEVIRKTDMLGTPTGETNMYMVPGLGATMFSIAFDPVADDQVTAASMEKSIESLASEKSGTTEYYYSVEDAAELSSAFVSIGTEIAYAANNARFVDQMGDAFDLQLSNTVERQVDGKDIEVDSKIEVKTYDIYTKAEADTDPNITADMIGMRKGSPNILETVTFNAAGTQAYSTLNSVGPNGETIPAGQNILINDVIYASTFFYNNNKDKNVTISTPADGEYSLASETFYWKVGTVQTQELAISYYVYLTDTQEGEREAGSYATNNFAILYYDNYLGNECKIETVSPMLAWKEANVSYAFYLVDTNGNVIVNRETGKTGTFANKIAITKPVVFATCKLNTANEVPALSVSETDLPDEYTIFDQSAVYKVVVLSYQDKDAATVDAGWTITSGKNVATTYVTGYSHTESYSNALNQNGNYDYTHTTVWFAVVWEPGTIADQVVIDYGLPVDINVLENDLFASGASLNAIGTTANKPTMADGHNYTSEKSEKFASVLAYKGDEGVDSDNALSFGRATVNGNKVRYTPTSTQMDTYDKFAYEVKFDYNGTAQYYYGDVTVIPATIIYYEESFVDFNNGYTVTVRADGTTNKDTAPQVTDSKQVSDGNEAYGDWVKIGETIDATQAEDRPGQYSLSYIDANNLYGYDGVYSEITKYSLGSAMQVTVNNSVKATDGSYTTTGYNGKAPTASFTFKGTGFDIISLTDSDSGMIQVTIKGDNGYSESIMITNYYGMSYEVVSQDENGNDVYGWVSTEKGALYQVPVIKKTGLTYGTYTVTIQVGYMSFFDQDNGGTGDGEYYFVLDSIRVYDPANGGANDNDSVIEDAYKADGESNPHYLMVKEAILGKTDLENLSPDNITGTLNGTVFIDGKGSTTDAADYANPGPNNEAYFLNAQSISFKLKADAVPMDVQLGAKLASGSSATVNVYYGSDTTHPVSIPLDSATDRYYSIMDLLPTTMTEGEWLTNTITIQVAAEGATIVSLTNIKATFESATPVSGSEGIKTASATASTGVYSLMSARMVNLETVAEEEPVSISFLVDAEVIEDACAVMTELYAPEPEIFVPEALEYTVTNRFFGNSTVNVITSKDVASLTVNGVEAKKLSNSPLFSMLLRLIGGFEGRFGTNVSANDFIIWSASVKRASNYDIVAYNADGLSSDPTVTDSSSSITKEDIDNYFNRSELYSIMEQMASQRFDPEQFEAYVNERFDGFREIITQTSEDVEYVIINGKIVDRYITETVIDTETGETTTKRVWITDAEDDVDDEDVEVNAYDEKGVGSESKKAERKFGWKKNSNNSNNNSNNGNSNSASDKNNNKENNGKGNSGKYVGM